MHHKAKGVAHQYYRNRYYKGADKLYQLYSPNGQYGKGNYFTAPTCTRTISGKHITA